MAKTSLIITTTETAGSKKMLQKTLTDINPAASNNKLVAFAKALNNLTTNIYSETNRVNRTQCDTEDSESVKLVPILSLSEFVSGSATVTYTGDGTVVLKVVSGTITLEGDTVTATSAGEGVLYALGTTTYASVVLPFVVP